MDRPVCNPLDNAREVAAMPGAARRAPVRKSLALPELPSPLWPVLPKCVLSRQLHPGPASGCAPHVHLRMPFATQRNRSCAGRPDFWSAGSWEVEASCALYRRVPTIDSCAPVSVLEAMTEPTVLWRHFVRREWAGE